jgi:hypothetical protein
MATSVVTAPPVIHKRCENNDRYIVSNDGRVFSDQPWRGTNFRELAQETHKQGYKIVTLSKPRKRMLVHVLVAEAFLPNRPEGHEVRHLDGNPSNNHVDNLAWGTRQDNIDDSKRHDTFARGSKNGNAILTEDDIVVIRKLIADGCTQVDIADLYGVSKACIASVATRSWQHV